MTLVQEKLGMLSEISAQRKLLDLFVEEVYSQGLSMGVNKECKTNSFLASTFRTENWDVLLYITICVNFVVLSTI
jgi:hypothetical protein